MACSSAECHFAECRSAARTVRPFWTTANFLRTILLLFTSAKFYGDFVACKLVKRPFFTSGRRQDKRYFLNIFIIKRPPPEYGNETKLFWTGWDDNTKLQNSTCLFAWRWRGCQFNPHPWNKTCHPPPPAPRSPGTSSNCPRGQPSPFCLVVVRLSTKGWTFQKPLKTILRSFLKVGSLATKASLRNSHDFPDYNVPLLSKMILRRS
jgi:hypothetical protein